ncbi:HlyC/CorC family transporter [Candidatus Micrarchaeota archaeon]|nr:HlyC/CorC family transporter [Candidatus Micrarchaeota archaeon]
MVKMILELIGLLILLAFSAFFSASEVALLSLSKIHVRKIVQQNVPGATNIEKLKGNTRKMLITILIGNNIVNIAASTFATALAISVFGENGIGISFGVMTFLILTFGEIFPKTIASHNAELFARFSAPIILFLEFILAPAILAFDFIPALITGKQPEAKPLVTEKDIRSMVQIGVEEKTIQEKEKELIEKVFQFNDEAVKTVMVPMEKVFSIPYDMPLQKALRYAVRRGYSRYPILTTDGKIEKILHIKEITRAAIHADKLKSIGEVETHPALIVEHNEKLSEVFKKMKNEHLHMAIVIDRNNKQLGIVTMEKVLERLVGEIHDEEEKRRYRL